MTLVIPPSTSLSNIDAAAQRLKESASAFAKMEMGARIELLRRIRQSYHSVAEASVRAACEAKGIDFNSQLAGEEWLAGPAVALRVIRLTEEALRDVQHYGAPRVKESTLRDLPDGRLAIKVFPNTLLDRGMLPGHEAEIYFQKHITRENFRQHQAAFYQKPHEGRLCLVLGAGNVNSITPTDCIYKMFVEGKVCLLKMNPVNAYLGPFLEQAFKAAVDMGFFAVVYGGIAEGEHLTQHKLVDEIHITGSDKTLEAIVWGPPGPDADARKKSNKPRNNKEISSELGNITPVMVVPGLFSKGEFQYQTKDVAGMVCNNASFNCNSAKLLVTSANWPQRTSFLDAIAHEFSETPARKAYYPGAEERWKQFTKDRKNLRTFGNAKPGELPYALIGDVDHTNSKDDVFNKEPWCTVLSETALEQTSAVSYIEDAVQFLNNKVWGTLCAGILVSGSSLKDPSINAAIEKAILDLQYGAVAINTWPAAAFALGTTPWGGHPTSDMQDIHSGLGWVHNTLMFEGIEKVVVRGPSKGVVDAPWFPRHATQADMTREWCEFEMNPSLWSLAKMGYAAIRA